MVGTLPSPGGGAVGDKGVRGSISLPGCGVKVILSSFRRAKGDDDPGRSHSVCRLSTIRDGVWAGGGGVFSCGISDAGASEGAVTCGEGTGCVGATVCVGGTRGMLKISPEKVGATGFGGGTEEPADDVVKMLDEKMDGFPSDDG